MSSSIQAVMIFSCTCHVKLRFNSSRNPLQHIITRAILIGDQGGFFSLNYRSSFIMQMSGDKHACLCNIKDQRCYLSIEKCISAAGEIALSDI